MPDETCMIHVLKANTGKNVEIKIEGVPWARFPIKTHVITASDRIEEVVDRYTHDYLQPGDIVFLSERIVAISQGRAYPIDSIKPSPLAKLLVKYVHKSPYGIGLKSPWTMQLAINEAGVIPIIAGALAAALTKPFGIKGVFYTTVGKNINAIDGPCSYTLPPYNRYAKLGPKKPHEVARTLSRRIGADVVIIDANDLGVNVLGKSNPRLPDAFCEKVFQDNPLGQTDEQTPVCIVRRQDTSETLKDWVSARPHLVE